MIRKQTLERQPTVAEYKTDGNQKALMNYGQSKTMPKRLFVVKDV